MSGVSYYQLLGIEPDASSAEIKAAWREATDKFEPGQGSGQFRLFNEAADVLLDPESRTAYDAEIGVEAAAAPAEPTEKAAAAPKRVTAKTSSKTTAKKAAAKKTSLTKTAPERTAPDEESAGDVAGADERGDDEHDDVPDRIRPDTEAADAGDARGRTRVPILLGSLLAVVTVVALVFGGVNWFKNRDDNQVQDAGDQASAAAERALPVILSYDYRHLKSDRDQAVRFLTPRYKREYTATFDKLITSDGDQPGPAAQAKAVVKASVQDVGVVSAESGRVRVIVFLNQATTKGEANPALSLNRLTVSMVKSGNSWLVEDITSY